MRWWSCGIRSSEGSWTHVLLRDGSISFCCVWLALLLMVLPQACCCFSWAARCSLLRGLGVGGRVLAPQRSTLCLERGELRVSVARVK